MQGLDTVPEDERPTIAEVNTVHLAWDVMVGLGTLLFLLSLWYGASLDLPARHAEEPVVPAHRRRARACLAVIAMEAGWVVSEVGRQPWIVYELMKVEDAATGEHRRLGHVPRASSLLYIGVGGHDDPRAARHEPPVPRRRRPRR